MGDWKRTTVTTIETHEVWIVRNFVPELPEVEVLTPEVIKEPETVSSIEVNAEGSNRGSTIGRSD